MKDAELRRAYAALLHASPTPSEAGRVPLEEILALVEQRGSESERLVTLDRVMADPASASEFEMLRAIAQPSRVTARRPAWVRAAGVMSLAAAVLLVAIPMLNARRDAVEPVRDAAAASELIAPAIKATVAESHTFRWHAVPGTRTYVVEILTASGVVVFATRSADTTITVPPDISFSTGAEYQWWVVSEMPDGTQRRSPFRRLTIVAP